MDQEATVCMARRAAKMLMFILLYSISKLMLKVLTNEKRGGLKVVEFDRSPFKLFTLKFSNKLVQAYPVKGLKLLREPCFYYLQTIIISQ